MSMSKSLAGFLLSRAAKVCLAWEGLGAPSTGRVMPARRLKSFGGGAGPSMGCGGWPAPTEVAKIVNLVLPGAQLLQY